MNTDGNPRHLLKTLMKNGILPILKSEGLVNLAGIPICNGMYVVPQHGWAEHLHQCRSMILPDALNSAVHLKVSVALYSALLDGECKSIILKDPPETQDVVSTPDGRGPAIEILNCLRITDIYQLPALLAPAEITIVGEMPESYKWSENLVNKLGIKSIKIIDNL